MGTLRRLLTTPTSKSTFLLGTFVGQLVPAWVQMALLIGFGGLVMGVYWGGGCWWPSELFPDVLLTVNKVLPTTWVMDGLNGLMLQGFGLMEVLPLAGVLLGFAVVFFLIGVWRFRFE
jgi:ABC-2 type transport system permease protein